MRRKLGEPDDFWLSPLKFKSPYSKRVFRLRAMITTDTVRARIDSETKAAASKALATMTMLGRLGLAEHRISTSQARRQLPV
jgi:hypothetical protein